MKYVTWDTWMILAGGLLTLLGAVWLLVTGQST